MRRLLQIFPAPANVFLSAEKSPLWPHLKRKRPASLLRETGLNNLKICTFYSQVHYGINDAWQEFSF